MDGAEYRAGSDGTRVYTGVRHDQKASAPSSPELLPPERICRHDRGVEQRLGMPGDARVRVSGVENAVSILRVD